jgi:putative peptidoglycan lipid II flippase
VLNVHDHFTIPALAPLVWNIVIIAGLVGLSPLFEGDDKLYAYALGVVAGTLVQLLMMIPPLRRIGFPVGRIRLPTRGDVRVKRVLMLMLPVSVGLGLINVNLLLNSTIGSLVSDQVPRAIDAAFRIYMLPQGMFSVAVATVLFPQLSRLATRKDYAGMQATIGVGLRQIALLLIPAGAAMLVLSDPMVRLVFQRGEFNAESTKLTAEALFWFSFSLPFSGFVLMLTRGFFALQRPWIPTTLAVGSLAINAIGSYALAGSMGIGGIVLGTTISNVALVLAEAVMLRRALGGFQTRETLTAIGQILIGATVLALVAYGVWWAVDDVLGRSLIGQILSVGLALIAGSGAYAAIVLGLKIPEARQIVELFAGRFRRGS